MDSVTEMMSIKHNAYKETDRISDGQPKACSSYDENSSCCKESDRLCDTCYENSLKIPL